MEKHIERGENEGLHTAGLHFWPIHWHQVTKDISSTPDNTMNETKAKSCSVQALSPDFSILFPALG